MFYYTFISDIGEITVIADENYIKAVQFGKSEYNNEKTPLISEAVNQLQEYFKGNRKVFTVPLKPDGTDFQRKVWKALTEIPYGQTTSYGKIAEKIGKSGGARAVGNANNKNPIAIMIPCHRVIGANGSLTGYAAGLDIKKQLLELEKFYCQIP